MSAPRDISYQSYLIESLKDPVEAAAYMEAVLELDDPAALLVALRQVAKAHGMAEVARRADVGEKSEPFTDRTGLPLKAAFGGVPVSDIRCFFPMFERRSPTNEWRWPMLADIWLSPLEDASQFASKQVGDATPC